MRFEDVYGRTRCGALSRLEAAEVPDVGERTFRRRRDRYEAEGAQGPYDRRLGRVSSRRAPVDEVARMLDLFDTRHRDFTSKRFHEKPVSEHGGRRSYDRVRLTLQAHGRAPGRPGIDLIAARSPQARGRSERMFGTLQRRLPQELRLVGVEDMGSANRFLRDVFLPSHNARFAVPADGEGSAFVPWAGAGTLADILRVPEERVVGNDNTVRRKRLTLSIPPDMHRRHYAKSRVRVREYPDGGPAVFSGPRRPADYDRTRTDHRRRAQGGRVTSV